MAETFEADRQRTQKTTVPVHSRPKKESMSVNHSLLDDADFWNAVLNEAKLAGARLCRANFDCADINKANLQAASLEGARFSGAHLIEADLSMTKLTGAELAGADLTKAVLFDAPLWQARLFYGDESLSEPQSTVSQKTCITCAEELLKECNVLSTQNNTAYVHYFRGECAVDWELRPSVMPPPGGNSFRMWEGAMIDDI